MRLGGAADRLRRALARAVPEGSVKVGLGLGVLGATSYGFTILSGRVLGPELLAPLAALWAAAFTIGPGLFVPIEQEISRSLSTRMAKGLGGLPVVRRAIVIAAIAAGGLVLMVALAGPLIVGSLFAGDVVLLFALLLAIVGSPAVHLVRGVLSGTRDFGRYGLVLAAEGIIRFGGAAVLAAIGVGVVGPYGVALGIAPLAASLIGLISRTQPLDDGPVAGWSELRRALGWLLAASVFAQLLVNGAPLVAMVLAGEGQAAEVGALFTGLVLARIPIFVFVAVQATLLPNLSASAAEGDLVGFRRSTRGLFRITAGAGVVTVIAGVLIGPAAIRVLFGPAFVLRGLDLGLLTSASVLYVLGIIGAQSLIALGEHAAAAFSWGVGLAAFAVTSAIPVEGIALRVEVAFLIGAFTSAVMFAWRIRRSLHDRGPTGAFA